MSAAGSIYDLGYRKYDGPRLGRRHAVRALFGHSLRVSYGIGRGGRAKIAPIVLGGLAIIPAIVGIGVLALARQMGAPGGVVEDAGYVRVRHGKRFEVRRAVPTLEAPRGRAMGDMIPQDVAVVRWKA